MRYHRIHGYAIAEYRPMRMRMRLRTRVRHPNPCVLGARTAIACVWALCAACVRGMRVVRD